MTLARSRGFCSKGDSQAFGKIKNKIERCLKINLDFRATHFPQQRKCSKPPSKRAGGTQTRTKQEVRTSLAAAKESRAADSVMDVFLLCTILGESSGKHNFKFSLAALKPCFKQAAGSVEAKPGFPLGSRRMVNRAGKVVENVLDSFLKGKGIFITIKNIREFELGLTHLTNLIIIEVFLSLLDTLAQIHNRLSAF